MGYTMGKLLTTIRLNCWVAWHQLRDENGQDLVEYAAVIALIVLALFGGMSTLANGINTAMASLSTQVNGLIG